MDSIRIGGLLLEISTVNDPADHKELEAYQEKFPHLPREYMALLKIADGFTGAFGEASEYVAFYSIREVAEANRSFDVPTNEPGFVLIGGNGGLDGFFASTRGDGQWMVLPMMDIGCKDVRLEDKFKCIEEFAHFLAHRYEES